MPEGDDGLLTRLSPPVAAWFRATYSALSPPQRLALPGILAGENILLSSPTGTGKTLAGFLGILSELHRLHAEGGLDARPYAVYVSPLKALVHDVGRNLQAPLAGIEATARAMGVEPPEIRVAIRTGDTTQAERERMLRAPPHILVTTPESLALVLASARWRPLLAGVRWVLVDEVHAIAETKRGMSLALALERLDAHATRRGAAPPARVGLSATVAPLDAVARWLSHERPCRILEVGARTPPDIRVALAHPDPLRAKGDEVEAATLRALEEIVQAHKTTIVFTNTRRAAERVARALEARLGDAVAEDEEDASRDPAHAAPETGPTVAPHHGSMSREGRLVVEERLKRGLLRCVVASSSLELGIDIPSVDHVVLLGSPKHVARTLQRVGRADHRLGGVSRATLLVDDPGDLAEAFALVRLARARRIEEVRVPRHGLDVLAQHVLACAVEGLDPESDAWRLAQRTWSYHDSPEEDFDAVVGHLAGGFRPLLREGAHGLVATGRARQAYLMQAGTIPESGSLRVVDGERYVGEVEEAFAEALAPGDVFQLAGAAWRFLRALPRTLVVEPARGLSPTLPLWRGEGLAMSPLLAAETAQTSPAFLSQSRNENDVPLSRLVEVGQEQTRFAAWPAPTEIALESIVDGDGRRAHVVHLWAGRRANEALARAAAHRLAQKRDVDVGLLVSDAGFALLTARGVQVTPKEWQSLLAPPLRPTLEALLPGSEALRRRFRHVAIRGFLLLRDEVRGSHGARQLAATAILGRLLRDDPDHPLLREARREVMDDAWDAEAAERIAAELAAGTRVLRPFPKRPCASPLAARILSRHERGTPERWEALRDAHEQVRDWLELNAEPAPRPG